MPFSLSLIDLRPHMQTWPGHDLSPRGYSNLFGPDVTSRFLAENNLLYIVRSHECQYYGYDLTHDDKVS